MYSAADRSRSSTTLAEAAFPLGAHLVTSRFGYTHHGIYVGGGNVVHYAGLSRLADRGPVVEVALAAFARGRPVYVIDEAAPGFAAEVIAARARSRLGEDCYRLVSNNCEHFCAWCVHGEGRSRQVERALAIPRAATAALSWIGRSLRIQPFADLMRL